MSQASQRAVKQATYDKVHQETNAILDQETNMILKMATINCIIKTHFPEYFWVGFYCVNAGSLIVGPYQGTLGCLHIGFDRGICGRAARTQQTQIVEDVHSDPEHIACDSRTNSEIVVPVLDNDGQLIAVLDIDSTSSNAFDQTDQANLEQLMKHHFQNNPLKRHFD